MLAFDVARADWCDALLESRLPARSAGCLRGGERSIRFYPRYDTEWTGHRRSPVALEAGDRRSARRRPAVECAAGAQGPHQHHRPSLSTHSRRSTSRPPTSRRTSSRFCRLEQGRYGAGTSVSHQTCCVPATGRCSNSHSIRSKRRWPVPGAIGNRAPRPCLGTHCRIRAGESRSRTRREGIASCPIPISANQQHLFSTGTGDAPHRAEHGGTRAVCLLEAWRQRSLAGRPSSFCQRSSKRECSRPVQVARRRDRVPRARRETYLRSGIAFVYVQVALASNPVS